ncbi:hypothetical protein ACFPA1_25000 [Neobacillus sp. GCM10023253]|uniref:hypothetical protein n=1 Tax=Neobacillus sp. GCM10023253 TaxID=3252644 RepID=UPI00361AAD24
MKQLVTEKKGLDWFWLVIVFLFSINFYGKGHFLLLLLLLVGLIVINYKKSKFKITIDHLLIFLFSISYFIILFMHRSPGIGAMLIYLIGPIACYFIGYFIIKVDSKFIVKTMLSITLGLFLNGLLNMINYFQIYGFNPNQTGLRVVPNIWSGGVLTDTLQGTYFALVSSILFYSFILLKKGKHILIPIILIGCTIFSIISSFILGNRTLIAVVMVSFVVSFLVYSYLERKSKKEFFKVLLFVSGLFSLVFIFYISNSFGLKEFVLNSTWYTRTETASMMDDARIRFYKIALSQMLDFPFGGYHMSFTYAHNLWFDVLNATGLIPFFFLLLYTLNSIKGLVNIIIYKSIDMQFKMFTLGIYLGFFLVFMVEPILEGVPYMFLLFILFNGMTNKYIEVYKSMRKSKGEKKYENIMANEYTSSRSMSANE